MLVLCKELGDTIDGREAKRLSSGSFSIFFNASNGKCGNLPTAFFWRWFCRFSTDQKTHQHKDMQG